MIPARFIIPSKAAVTAIAAGVLVSGCYYPPYPDYPGAYYSTVPTAYAQREFAVRHRARQARPQFPRRQQPTRPRKCR